MTARRFAMLLLAATWLTFVGCGSASEREIKRLHTEKQKLAKENRQLHNQLLQVDDTTRRTEERLRERKIEVDSIRAESDLLKETHEALKRKLAWTEERLGAVRKALKEQDARLGTISREKATQLIAEANTALLGEIKTLEDRLRAVETERDRLRVLCRAGGLDPDLNPEPPKDKP